MKRLGIYMMGVLLLFTATVSSAYTLSDFDLQTKLENFFTRRMVQRKPDMHFAITVKMHIMPDYRMQSIRDGEPESQLSYGVDKRVEEVDFFSEESINPKEVAEILSIPVEKLRVTKLAKRATPVTEKKEAPFTQLQEKLGNYVSHLEEFLFTVQLGMIFLVISVVLVGLYIVEVSKSAKRKNITKPKRAARPLEKATEYTSEQLKSIFAECYWTRRDAEACTLLQKYPRVSAYKELSFGADYIHYLKNVIPGPIQFLSDPYFLDTIPAFHEVSVEDTPASALEFASQIRFEAKNLDTHQLIAQASLESFDIRTWAANPSRHRKLRFGMKITFKTIEEENSILTNSTYSDAVKLSLPSLYRLFRLDAAAFNKFLGALTAQEVAEAWIGPDWLLNAIEERMTPAQRRSLLSLTSKVKPSRESESYKKIISSANSLLEGTPVTLPPIFKIA